MIKELNNKSLAYGIPGLLLQSTGLFINPFGIVTGLGIVIGFVTLIGTVLLVIGLAYYAKAKGHSGYFGLFGLLGIIGLFVLIPLKDKCITPEEQQIKKTTKLIDLMLGILLGLGLIVGSIVILVLIFQHL